MPAGVRFWGDANSNEIHSLGLQGKLSNAHDTVYTALRPNNAALINNRQSEIIEISGGDIFQCAYV